MPKYRTKSKSKINVKKETFLYSNEHHFDDVFQQQLDQISFD